MTLVPALRRIAPTALLCFLFVTLALAPRADANRALLSEAALETTFCLHCPPPLPQAPLKPPNEGQIEGACGLAIKPGGGIYASDYYHRTVDIFGTYSGSGQALYQSQIALPGSNSTLGTNTLNAVCSLAFDSAGSLYANEYHQRVMQLTPSEVTIDAAEATGLAVDVASDRLYVDERTAIAEYGLPFTPEDQPLARFAVDPDADYFGLAAFGGRLYVADAATETVKVFEPEPEPEPSTSSPVKTLTGFNSLSDAALAIDPTNGHLLVVDNTQPLFEHPISQVREFGSPAEGYPNLGALPGSPIHGSPSGIAVGPTGIVLVTDGNSELSNAFAYGPYGTSSLTPLAPAAATAAGFSSSSTAGYPPPRSAAAPSLREAHHRRHRRHRKKHWRTHVSAGSRISSHSSPQVGDR